MRWIQQSAASRLALQRSHVVYSARPFDLVSHWTPIIFKATAGVGGVTAYYVTAVVEEVPSSTTEVKYYSVKILR